MTPADDLTDGATIDAFWVNPTLDGATPGQVLAATAASGRSGE